MLGLSHGILLTTLQHKMGSGIIAGYCYLFQSFLLRMLHDPGGYGIFI